MEKNKKYNRNKSFGWSEKHRKKYGPLLKEYIEKRKLEMDEGFSLSAVDREIFIKGIETLKAELITQP